MNTTAATVLAMHNAFGSPESTRKINSDNTGVFANPLPGSQDLAPHNRLYHIHHKLAVDHLTGSGLAELGTRFVANLEKELLALEIGTELD